MRERTAEQRVDRHAERAALEVEQRHLDRGFRLEALRRFAVHARERVMQVERIGAHEYRCQARDGVVDVDRRHE